MDVDPLPLRFWRGKGIACDVRVRENVVEAGFQADSEPSSEAEGNRKICGICLICFNRGSDFFVAGWLFAELVWIASLGELASTADFLRSLRFFSLRALRGNSMVLKRGSRKERRVRTRNERKVNYEHFNQLRITNEKLRIGWMGLLEEGRSCRGCGCCRG